MRLLSNPPVQDMQGRNTSEEWYRHLAIILQPSVQPEQPGPGHGHLQDHPGEQQGHHVIDQIKGAVHLFYY